MSNLRLLLINPSKKNALMAENDKAVFGNMGSKPPLQLLFLVNHIEQTLPEVEIQILDAQILKNAESEIIKRVIDFNPDVVGITSCTEFWYDTELLVQNIKKVLPETHICIGGPNAGIYPDTLLMNKNVDSVVCGNGEKPLESLIRKISKKPGERVDGIYFKSDLGRISEFRWNTDRIDTLSHPLNRTGLPLNAYSSIFSDGIATSMVTSRGCPYNCVYCKILPEKFHLYPLDFVIAELKSIQSLGIKDVEIYDDTFTVSKERVISICNRMIEENIRLSWSIRDRATGSDIGLLKLMKKAGLKRINYGIEAADDQTLERINKGIKISDVELSVKNAKKAGLVTFGYFMIGLPGNTVKEFKQIVDLSCQLDLDYANFSAVIAYPGTKLYAMALGKGIFKEDVWKKYIEHPTKGGRIPLYTEKYDSEFLMDFVKSCYRRFYFRPKAVLNEIKKTTSIGYLRKKAKMGLALLRQ